MTADLPADPQPATEAARRSGSAASRPDDPLGLDGSGWLKTLAGVRTRLVRDRVTMAAGSLAYHWFLALFPAVIAALGLLGLLDVGRSTLAHIIDGLGRALPPGTAAVFDAAVTAATKKSSGSLAAVLVGIVAALWSSTSGMAVLEQALDIAYEVPEDRKFLARRLHALPLMVVTAVLGGLAAALIVFARPIGSAIEGVVAFSGTPFSVVWTIVRWLLAVVLVALMFSSYYYLGTNRRRPRWQWVSPGSALATAIFLAASLGFSYYVSAFGSYSKTYGSFAGVAILIFWLWLSGLAVLIGGELNAEVEREAARRSGAQDSSPTAVTGPGEQVPQTRAAS